MNKKYLSVILFSALMLGTTGTFTSCKDYDDDIANLQDQLDKKASLEDLKAEVSKLEAAITEAKSAAADAKAKAEEALEVAQGAGSGDVTEEQMNQAIEDAKEELQAQIDKLAKLTEVESMIAELKQELAKEYISQEELKTLSDEVTKLSATVMQLVGHRLTSLSVIATDHVNGIAAISIKTLRYTPQVYTVNKHDGIVTDDGIHAKNPWLDHSDITGADELFISSQKNKAYFHVAPTMGVQKDDITMPSFDCITSNNTTASTKADIVVNNKPIQPVDYVIDGDEMEVTFKKTTTAYIGTEGDFHKDGEEKFYMASLKAPIAEKNLTEKEIEEGTEVAVNSEYVRIEEKLYYPYLANAKAALTPNKTGFADEVDANGNYIHYHDSACVYNSEAMELIDYKFAYDEVVDLKTLVTACFSKDEKDHAEHEQLADYKDYGLSFRFYLPTTPYITLGGEEDNSNKTDQQKFAEIDNAMNGHLTSKVYTINGTSATAVGREPLVRICLVDTVNNNLVAQRYMKIKWVKETVIKDLPVEFADTLYVCGEYNGRVNTVMMNEDIYAKAKEGGMTKREFHAIYTKFEDKGEGDGSAEEVVNSEEGVDSYNILWTLGHDDIVKKYPNWNTPEKLDFEKVVYWSDPTQAYPTLKIILKRTIYKPTFGNYGYDARYWRDKSNYTVFNINPIVYGAKDFNPAWNETDDHLNNPTCNIYTDLLNGFLDKNGKMPMLGADLTVWYQDYKVDANGNVDFNTPLAKADYYGKYATEGVKYVFDAEKLASGTNPDGNKYEFPYFDGSKTVMKTATVSPDGTKLYINNELAAEIINYGTNLCTSTDNERRGARTYNIRLKEKDPAADPYGDSTENVYSGESVADPTEAAKALVGQYVPVKMIADICDDNAVHAAAHTTLLKAYDAFIIRPLTVESGETDDFTDATIDGTTIDVKDAFTYTCWNADATGKKYTASISAGATALQKELWRFYECQPGEWMTKEATTNLELVDGNLVPSKDPNYKSGPLPNNTSVVYNATDETLTYYNYSGTPVNQEYKIFVPVKFGYKWETKTELFEVLVKKNAGDVPAN